MENMISESNGVCALRMLGLDPVKYRTCLEGWGDSFVHLPENIDFLDAGAVMEYCSWGGMSRETGEMLCAAAEKVVREPALKAYLWHMFYRLKTPSFSSGCSPVSFANWPLPEPSLGPLAKTAPALVLIGALRAAREKYRSEGYAESMIRDTLGVYHDALENGRRKNGVCSMSLTSLNWVRVYMAARLVQLGRFNFKLMEDFSAGIMLKNRKTGAKQLLAPGGKQYNSRGFMLQEDDPLAEGGWTSELTETEDAWTGCPVSPEGFALKTPRRYEKAQWEKIFSEGDIILDMHIPGGGGMTPERCIDSFRKASAFFREKYPGRFNPVILSHSWIFNTQFEKKLPESNLAKLMRECYLFPASSYGRDGMYFLFGRDDFKDLSEAPRDTSVRRAMLEILESGERLRTGGMLLFLEDLEWFGTSYYRRNSML